MSTVLRPYGILLGGKVEIGLELVFEERRLVTVRPHTGLPEPFLVTPAFENAHSHFEYRGLLGMVGEHAYWPWIRKLTALKSEQTPEGVRADCIQAAQENRATGIWWVEEHSDRPYSGEAMGTVGLQGTIYQEVITFLEQDRPEEKLRQVEVRAEEQRRHFTGPVVLNPHAFQTVDPVTLAGFRGKPVSIHVAETEMENQLTREGTGPLADFRRSAGFEVIASGRSVVEALDEIGLVAPTSQFVHCCAVSPSDIEKLAAHSVRVAHCPRSNAALGCRPAPVRELLDAGIRLGLGLDSAASSGPIDMFAEMRSALATSRLRGRPVSAEEVWQMATGGKDLSESPLLKLHLDGVYETEEILERGEPGVVEWVDLP